MTDLCLAYPGCHRYACEFQNMQTDVCWPCCGCHAAAAPALHVWECQNCDGCGANEAKLGRRLCILGTILTRLVTGWLVRQNYGTAADIVYSVPGHSTVQHHHQLYLRYLFMAVERSQYWLGRQARTAPTFSLYQTCLNSLSSNNIMQNLQSRWIKFV